MTDTKRTRLIADVSPQSVACLDEFAKKIGYRRNHALEIAIARALADEENFSTGKQSTLQRMEARLAELSQKVDRSLLLIESLLEFS